MLVIRAHGTGIRSGLKRRRWPILLKYGPGRPHPVAIRPPPLPTMDEVVGSGSFYVRSQGQPKTSTLCRRQNDLTVSIPYRQSSGAPHLLIDSTGTKAMGEGEWSCRKHGASRPRQWCKLHLGIDAETLEVRAIEVTGSRVGDGPMLPRLLEQIPPDEPIGTVTADGAYDTRACHTAIAGRQATAVIPTRRNGRPWKETTPGAHARNEILRASRRLGRAIWRNWSGYHRRSLIEAKMRCMKLMGERLMSRTANRQTAELQIRAALLNRFTALGSPETKRVA
jgi:hypothetical protein